MLRSYNLLAASATIALAFGAAPAFASGTLAGATIINTATINYQVGGIAQTAQSASNAVVVDRKIVLTVASAPTTTTVSPGQTGAPVAYTITNSSNDTIDIGLSLVQQAGGTAQHGGTDVFDTSNVKYYADTNANGVYDAGVDTQITFLDEVAPDTTRTVFVVSDIPIATTNGQVSGNILTATALAGGTPGSAGAILTTSGANTAGVDTVLADAAGVTDIAFDGKYSASGDYTVSAPTLTVTKTSKLISDPVSGTTNPKAIPGAVLEYCISVSNAAGSATATNLAVTDALPVTVAYSTAFGIFLNGTVTGGTCNADVTAGGSYNAGTTTVSGALADLSAGATETLLFRATIQ